MNPIDLIAALRLESGATWGETAADFQWADVEAVLDQNGPLWHFITRPRGGSKSTDEAAVLLAWAACIAGPGERGYIIATDADQGVFAILDAISGFVSRTPELKTLVTLQANKVIAKSGASVEVLAVDAASTRGLRPAIIVVDEIAAWPSTRNARNTWTALVSSTGKMPGCRLVILTSAGEPHHWSYRVLESARASDRWHTSETLGPLPWVDPANLEAQRPLLRESEFDRDHLNIWTVGEDRLVTAEDLAAAAVLDGPLEPTPNCKYMIAVDLGLVNDRTICVVAHAERAQDFHGAQYRVVVDRIARWRGKRLKPVSLAEVEAWLVEASNRYNHARVVVDPWQAAGLVQRLHQRNVHVEEFVFSSASVGRIASGLHLALRNRLLHLPNDEDLLSELGNVRLRETTPGVVRLDHDSGAHDDQAVAVGLTIVVLSESHIWQPSTDEAVVPTHDITGKPFVPIIGRGIVGDSAIPWNVDRGDEDPDVDVSKRGKSMPSPYV